MRKTACIFLILLFLSLAASSLAQTTLTVLGEGEAYVPADTAVIFLGVSCQSKDVMKAQSSVNEAIANIRRALTMGGIPAEDINTDYINIHAVYDYSGSTEHLAAYGADSTLAIRTTEIDRVGEVIDLAFSAGANTLNSIDFSASDTAEARKEALRAAVQNAQEKAAVLAEASGLTLSGIASLSENGTYSYANTRGFDGAQMSKSMDAATVVQSARLCVSATVTVSYSAQ